MMSDVEQHLIDYEYIYNGAFLPFPSCTVILLSPHPQTPPPLTLPPRPLLLSPLPRPISLILWLQHEGTQEDNHLPQKSDHGLEGYRWSEGGRERGGERGRGEKEEGVIEEGGSGVSLHLLLLHWSVTLRTHLQSLVSIVCYTGQSVITLHARLQSLLGTLVSQWSPYVLTCSHSLVLCATLVSPWSPCMLACSHFLVHWSVCDHLTYSLAVTR